MESFLKSHAGRAHLGLTVALTCLFSIAAHAQKGDASKVKTATTRLTTATKALGELSALPPEEGIPKELLDGIDGIAVFPDSSSVSLLSSKFMKGYGVMSFRMEGHWSTPAFYGFVTLTDGWPKLKAGKPALIVLFRCGSSADASKRDGMPFHGESGPVGPLKEGESKKARHCVDIYTLGDGKLKGITIEDDSETKSAIKGDNNLNEAVFGLKAHEVISGTTPPTGSALPSEITEFQNAVTHLITP